MHPDRSSEEMRAARREAFRIVGQETDRLRAQQRPFVPLRIVNPTSLEGQRIPQRRWIVQGWLPVGHVTINFGDGGLGKTLLGQQLMTSTALGTPWCGLEVERCKSLGLFCEDDDDELHRRQEDILRSIKAPYTDLGDMLWASGVGLDNVLVRYDRDGIGEPTQRLTEIREAAIEHGARLLVLDTAADLFGGNENDRQQVRNFIGEHLNALARAIDGAVLLNAHPSKSGMSATGDMTSGSTGWSNTARSRWSLERPIGDDGYPIKGGDERILTKRKANYAAVGDEIRLMWQDGVLLPLDTAGAPANSPTRQAHAEKVFLSLVERCAAQNVFVSNSRNAGNFAPKVFEKRPEREGVGRKDFEAAMHRLFAADKLVMLQYGRKADVRYRIAVTGEKERAAAAVPASDDEVAILADWHTACDEARAVAE